MGRSDQEEHWTEDDFDAAWQRGQIVSAVNFTSPAFHSIVSVASVLDGGTSSTAVSWTRALSPELDRNGPRLVEPSDQSA